MKIKTKILWAWLGICLLVALVGALAVDRQRVAAQIGAIQEAENVARILGFILLSSNNVSLSAQEIVSQLSLMEKRDVVLVDTNQLILADVVVGEIGKIFTEDTKDEVGATLRDRRTRIFIENSADYPVPIKQVVVPAMGASGDVVGAVILEYTPLYEELMASTRVVKRQVIAAVCLSVLMAMLMAFYMGRSIVLPLQQLTKVAAGFASGRTDLPMPPPRGDEVGELADAFGNMVRMRQHASEELQLARDTLEKRVEERTLELEKIHKQLLEVSRRGGMAEIATNVLHNVGNVLNSVNVSTGLIADGMKKSRLTNLAKVVLLLREHAHDLGAFMTTDPKGRQLPAYLAQLSECLLSDQASISSEVDLLRRNIEHIKEIVAMQQNYAMVGGVKEMVNLVDLVEDSLRMNEGAFNRHRVEIIREFENVPAVNVEKHKILQILVNLLRNAKYACDESGQEDRRLTVRVAAKDGRVRIAVIDNGVGISPENLTRIFNHGFTTRKGGHGYGLHSGALAAKEIGGSLAVHSAGLGQGASFILDLPCPPTESAHE